MHARFVRHWTPSFAAGVPSIYATIRRNEEIIPYMLKTKNLVSNVLEYNSMYCDKDYADIYRNNKSIVGFYIYKFDSYAYFSRQHFSVFTGSFYTLWKR